jgi:CHAT domain-containing protein
MTALKKIYLLALCLTGAVFLRAQKNERTETKNVWFTIGQVFQKGDTVYAYLAGASNVGLVNGLVIKACQSYQDAIPGESPERPFREVGSGIVVLADSLEGAFIKMYHDTDLLEKDDVVSLKLAVPYLPYRSIFSELAFMNILYADKDKVPLYSLQSILENDSRANEDSIYNSIEEDLHAAYQKVKDRPALDARLTQKAIAGRFKGRTALEVLRDATRKDIESFLLYVSAYPAGYMGRHLRFSESFAAWLVSNSPYSAGEVKRALFPFYKDKSGFAKKAAEYKADAISEGTAATLGEEAEELSGKGQYKEAGELADFAILLANTVNDSASKASANLSKALVHLEQDKYPEAISAFDKTIRVARETKDRATEIKALIKKGYCLYRISKYKEAQELLNTATNKLKTYKTVLVFADYSSGLEKIYQYKADIFYAAGEYNKALHLLDTAISINNQINSYDANNKNAGYYKFIGQVYNEQGKPLDALENFNKAADIYRNNNDILNVGRITNEIAYSYFIQGEYRKSILFGAKASRLLIQQGDENSAGFSKSVAGSAYWELGKYDSALASHREAIALRKKSNNFQGMAFSLKKMGEMYLASGSKPAALEALDSALFFYRAVNDSGGISDIYNKKGEVFLNDENFIKASFWFEKAKGFSSKITIEQLYQLGTAWYAIDTTRARSYLEYTRQRSRMSGNTGYQFYAAISLASLAYRARDFFTGDQYYKECLNLSQQINTPLSKASCLELKARKFEAQLELDSALGYYHQALVVVDTISKGQTITELNNIAGVYISKGEFQKADEAYKKGIAIAREMSDSISLGSLLQTSAFLYSRTAEFAKGMSYSDSAMRIFQQSGHMIRLASTYGSMAALLNSMGEYRKSVNAYLIADSIYKSELQEEMRGTIFNNIAVVYLGQADYSKALQYLDKSLATIKKGVTNENYFLVKGNMAECLAGLKKPEEAKKLLLDLLPRVQRLQLNRVASGMALLLGRMFYDENKLVQSAGYFNYAREYADASGEKEKMIEALESLGKINARDNKPDSAAMNLKQSVALMDQYKIASGWTAYYELGLLFYNGRRFDSAVVYFKKAVAQLDKNTENLYGGEEAKKIFSNDPRKSDLYNKITFAYYNLGDIKEAWGYANRSNIAGIKELSGSLSVNSGDEERNEALRKLLSMQESKKALENNLGQQEGISRRETLKKIEILEADYNNFLQDVITQFPDLSTYFSRTNADEFNNYKGKLPNDVAVALYLLNDKTLMIFTLTNEKLAVDTMTLDIAPRVSSFIATIKNTKKQTGTGPLSERSEPQDEEKTQEGVEFKDISDELYNDLIATVEDKIGTKKKLCIIPTGVFSNMPFQCLGRKMPGNNFRFLLEDHAVFYTNKMSVFNPRSQADSAGRVLSSFAAFGVPDPSLSYNIAEVKEIGKILGADSTVYTDSRATESMAKRSLQSKKYIHFATHGVLNYSSDFSLSYLKLLPDKDTAGGNNGQLTMREIQRLGIRDCDMVILSACQTAVNKQLVEGWNISPANSFLVSHVKTVVASLWKVADEPTELLMKYFYQNLSQKMDKVESLRQAQIKLSQDTRFRHPNYWGAFVLYGEWR